jgi:hypothetical protein
MKKSELTAMTVVELNALARKNKVSLTAGARKADIVAALMVSTRNEKPVKKIEAPKETATKKAAARPPAAKKSTAGKAPGKQAAEKRTATKQTTAKQAVTKPKAAVEKKLKAAKAPAPRQLPETGRTQARKRPAQISPVNEWKLPPGVEEPLLAQERVAESKFYTGQETQTAASAYGELPKFYGSDRIVIMTRDPFVVHAYWEATPERLEREKAWFGWESKLCLRIYDITGVQFDGRNAIGYFDQEVFERSGNWYFDLGRPSHSFCADLGLLSPAGRFLTLSRSNYITMPRDGASDVIDEEWMLVDEEFWKLYGYPAGFKGGASSPELQEMMRRRREQELTSPGLFSRERAKVRRK